MTTHKAVEPVVTSERRRINKMGIQHIVFLDPQKYRYGDYVQVRLGSRTIVKKVKRMGERLQVCIPKEDLPYFPVGRMVFVERA